MRRVREWVVRRLSRGAPQGREFQEHMDMSKLDLVTSLREAALECQGVPAKERIREIAREVSERSLKAYWRRVHAAVHPQVINSLELMRDFDYEGRVEVAEREALKPPALDEEGGDSVPLAPDYAQQAIELEAARARLRREADEALRRHLGFHLSVVEHAPSTSDDHAAQKAPRIPMRMPQVEEFEDSEDEQEAEAAEGAMSRIDPIVHANNRGVFLHGHVLPGTVVAMYPGRVYPADRRIFPGAHNALLTTPGLNMMARLDRSILDGTQVSQRWNPLALGHLVRHPPSEDAANVAPFSYDFPAVGRKSGPGSLARELEPWIPNVFYAPPLLQTSSAHVQGILLITTKEVADEELFMPYRLNPSLRRPEWYKDWTEEETRHLWLEFTNGGQPTDAHAGPEEKKPE